MSVTDIPSTPRPAPTAGVDWAKDDHAISIVGPDGERIRGFSVEHTVTGLRTLVRRLLNAGVNDVAIERPDGPVVDAIRQGGLTVYVIAPNQLKNLRSRYGSAGNKDDRFDAYVLADTLRTDRRRLRPLVPDTDQTITLRMTCRARKDLVGHRVALANQLRGHLQLVFPGAVGLFSDLDSAIGLRFRARFPSQDKADWLSAKRFDAWLRGAGYCGRKTGTDLHAHLVAAPRGTSGPDSEARAHITLALHPDAPIFQSLPRSGTVRAARLLAEIGDARGRFPTPEALTCLAGVAPSTRASGKVRAVTFRWAADKQLRDAVTDFAGDSRHANPWAADLYHRAIARGHDHPHATRILARAWLHIICKCWQTSTPYDPTRHGALQTLLGQHDHADAA